MPISRVSYAMIWLHRIKIWWSSVQWLQSLRGSLEYTLKVFTRVLSTTAMSNWSVWLVLQHFSQSAVKYLHFRHTTTPFRPSVAEHCWVKHHNKHNHGHCAWLWVNIMKKSSPHYAKWQNIKQCNAHCRHIQSLICGYATYPHHSATCVLYITLRCLIPLPKLDILTPKVRIKTM